MEMHACICTLQSIADTDVPSVAVYTGQGELALQSTVHHTPPNAYECTIQDGVIQAMKKYKLVVNCDNQSVHVSFTTIKSSCECTHTKLAVICTNHVCS